MSSRNYYRSWMDKTHLDPNTNLLTEEYAEGIGEFMRLVQQQPKANTSTCSSCNNNRIIKEWDGSTSEPQPVDRLEEPDVDNGVGHLVGLARRASTCPSSSQALFAPPDPMIIQQLQNKDDRIVVLETQNATILAELAGQKKTNEEILEKMKRLFPAEFS
ncbi:hypothetical protein F2Q70_00001405 [Brassica cretica]|uniref:Uncharacterized protein n=1 Tax=Brassica cretica TaxID=69181 RepID=A0A8S9IM82_BRACR|nr:hypothetical protein F2Q70_00001405 [Brassica cretica]